MKRILATGAALWFITGCAQPNDITTPEAAYEAFGRALTTGRTEAAWTFLGPQTRAGLERIAEDRERVLGEAVAPHTLLRAAWLPSVAEVDTVERAHVDGDSVSLHVTPYMGTPWDVTMHRRAERWTLDVALPEPWCDPCVQPQPDPADAETPDQPLGDGTNDAQELPR